MGAQGDTPYYLHERRILENLSVLKLALNQYSSPKQVVKVEPSVPNQMTSPDGRGNMHVGFTTPMTDKKE